MGGLRLHQQHNIVSTVYHMRCSCLAGSKELFVILQTKTSEEVGDTHTGSVGVSVAKEDVCVFMTPSVCEYGGWGAAACQEGPVCIGREAQRGKILSGACLGHCFPHSVCSVARGWGVRGETSGSVPCFCQAFNASNTFLVPANTRN